MADARRSVFLPGGEPAPGRIARAFIETRDDIAALETYSFEQLLPAGTILECIEAAAAIDPDKAAIKHLISADPAVAPRVITYRELVAKMRAAAALFEHDAQGARPAVGVMLPMLPEAHIAGWAASAVGVCCQINPFLEIGIIASILNAAQASTLVTTSNVFGPGAWDKVDALKAAVPTLKTIYLVGVEGAANDFDKALEAQASRGLAFKRVADPQAEATYLPTGGTTAAPKLVRMTQLGQLVNAWINGALGGPSPDGVVGHAMPNFHVGGYVVLGLRALIFGQTLLTLTTGGFRNPDVVARFWDIARAHGMTTVLATPATAAALLAVPNANAEGHTIKVFHCGASTIPVALANAFKQKFGIWLREMWGMTEVHGVVTCHPNGIEPVIGSVGVQMPHQPVKAIIVNDKNEYVRECAPGERGALVITGPGVTKGYVNPALNAGFHVKNTPDGKLWGNTGDLGMIDKDGYVWVFGRAKDVIIRGGHNIDATMIEEVLVRHPAVLLAAAIGRPDADKGELPIAYVQLKPGAEASAEELLALCRKEVQERAAVPVDLTIVDAMPMTAVGKMNKPVLRRRIAGEVAQDVAALALAGARSFDVAVDESGARPHVTITLQGTRDAALEDRLKTAFRTYEFNTTIAFAG
ncbi:MAG: AMP-binding protein [Methylobacteriaceae bacterium]|nr:AMP-binding protein [Methylobacteriaceae bacterium]